jgi:hypothetical protein
MGIKGVERWVRIAGIARMVIHGAGEEKTRNS